MFCSFQPIFGEKYSRLVFLMASYLFDNDSNCSSECNDFNYVTPVRNNRVFRKLFDENGDEIRETINLDVSDDDVDNIGGKFDNASNSKGRRKMDFESDKNVNIGKKDVVNDDVHNGEEYFGSTFANMNDIVPFVGMRFDSLQEAEVFL